MENKVAIVTGAGTGIGRGIALALARRGARVVVHYNRHREGADETVRQIIASGGQAMALGADLEEVAACQRLIAEAVEACGAVDILVNNAAISSEARFLEVSPAAWDQTINVNLRAPFFCAQAAVPQMIQRGGGRIINISSVHGLVSAPVFAAYAAAKGGLNMLTRQLAVELAPHRITVNCVAPGAIEVERYYTQFPAFDPAASARKIPLGRMGQPEDIGAMVAFLCSEEASFVTGQVVVVDGGQISLLALSRPGDDAYPYASQVK
ncbi:MAG: SDR family oxidoreductase [Chloroflexi bacterium]|nr:SDR family oxidoreductase [Chloroflexota bacterium]